MRKWFVVLMTIFGVLIFIMLGYGAPTVENRSFIEENERVQTPDELTDEQKQSVEMKVVVSMDPQAFAPLLQRSLRFQRDTPEMKVQVINVPLQKLVAGNFSADVILYPASWIRHLASQGRLMALDEFVSAERQSQWFDLVLRAMKWNGYVWAVPYHWNPYVLLHTNQNFERLAVVEDDAYAMDLLQPSINTRAPLFNTDLQKVADAQAAVEAVVRGEGSAAFVTLTEAIRHGQSTNSTTSELSVSVLQSWENALPQGMIPYTGDGFVVSPDTSYVAEAMEWILYMTDQAETAKYLAQPWERLSVHRTAFGLSSLMNRDAQSLQLNLEAPPNTFPLPRLVSGDSWSLAATLIDSLESIPVEYGFPPVSIEDWVPSAP
jgi:hypothetical protein